ncbi:right-handed parallel beta-helix repeat-containing protein [Chroococcidiopsis sp. FACHB-1243]|uniref:right-handed parallel beta-helix repeat-containing protein n=1 Tax=Chroococcidiopsis sp. [FACHB-1243] TaxID=2692781 RepID=UPI00177D493E|nr:right-handed parallel beta-helix repeat-containing protein [Chroococcidiopsis sp. [FACHB-1243]]MBD2305542.1 right-handed parallel beta-helix repeat-containing protein [Chroococcidiopsis sp. [FACHB-1243]]
MHHLVKTIKNLSSAQVFREYDGTNFQPFQHKCTPSYGFTGDRMNKLRILLFATGILISFSISASDRSHSPHGYLLSSSPLDAANVAREYFVASKGSDNHPGTLERPFQTVQKCASVAQPGDSCLLRAGIYRETVRPANSGTSSTTPITFAAYNKEDVTISGANLVEGWQVFRGSIFRANASLPTSKYNDTGFFANQVFVNGEMMPEARWPNTGRDPLRPKLAGGGVRSLSGNAAIVENAEIPNLAEGWTGATVWTNDWYVTRTGTITGGTAGKLTAQMTAPWDRGGYWFYLVGKLGLLDSEGEWFYDGSDRTLYLWTLGGTSPNSVEVKQRNFAFDLGDRSYIVLRNLKLFASTVTTSNASKGVVIDGIRAKYVSHHMTLPPLPKSEQAPNSDDGLIVASHAHDTGIQLRGSKHTLKNSVVEWSSGNGVLLEGTGHRVTNNIIANSNYMASYAAPVRINGTNHRITYNTIEAAGRDAISFDWHTAGFDGNKIDIAYNDISRFGMLSTDLGAIYICCYINLAGGAIHHNWIRDTQAFSPFWGTRGIYLDIESYNSTIHHNVVWNITGGKDSFYLVAGSPRGYNRIFNNTFLGSIYTDKTVEARNNILRSSTSITASQQSHNLFQSTDPKFTKATTTDSKSIPDFTLQSGSPAIDAGMAITGVTDGFVGSAPDIGAYERGAKIWRAGSRLKR